MTDQSTNKSVPNVVYRIQSERSFEINNDFSDVRNRARQLVVLRNCLFGKKRYQTLILNSSLNNFFNSLRIAQVLHANVPDMAMIIRFIEFVVVEMLGDNSSKSVKRRRVEIKLTRNPNEEDKAQAGFNPGYPREKIERPIEDVVPRREPREKGERGDRVERGQRRGNARGRGNRREPGRTERRPPQQNNYRRGRRYEQLQDEQEYRRERDQREERNYREQKDNRDNNRTYARRGRGGARGNQGNQGREQTEHNYKSSHIKK